MTADMHALLELGAACVRLAHGGKVPLGQAWNTLATTSGEVVSGWLDAGNNVGILLGHGNLIDVEYDDATGMETLARMGLLDIRTPTWASGRGEHRLFRLAGEVPPMGWKKVGGAEMRIGGKPAQSVLPPSTHPTGRPYEWLVSPADCQPAVVTLSQLGIGGAA